VEAAPDLNGIAVTPNKTSLAMKSRAGFSGSAMNEQYNEEFHD
jgi:hypothetical protein